MKVIKNNHKAPESSTTPYLGEHKCPFCESVLFIEMADIVYSDGNPTHGPNYEAPYSYYTCPCCRRMVTVWSRDSGFQFPR